jgi:hypothetical protein
MELFQETDENPTNILLTIPNNYFYILETVMYIHVQHLIHEHFPSKKQIYVTHTGIQELKLFRLFSPFYVTYSKVPDLSGSVVLFVK